FSTGTIAATSANLTFSQTLLVSGSTAAFEGTVVRGVLSSAYPTIAQPPTLSTAIEDFGYGAATGALVRGAERIYSGRGVTRLFTRTEDIGAIVSSKRFRGQTEGRPYASALESCLGAGRKTRDPATIVWEGEPVDLYQPHPVDGPFSAWKRLARKEFQARQP